VIVSRRDEGWVLVRQVDHQAQCADMARAWGGGGFRPLGNHEAAVTAARWHDEGWRAWEEHPQVDVEGRPEDFPDIDRTAHVTLYREGIDEVCRIDPLAGLIASMHGTGLYRARLGLDHVIPGTGRRPAAVEAFLEHEDLRQARLRARLGHGPAEERWAWAAYRLLQAWDLLSLALLWGRLAQRDQIVLRRVPVDEADADGTDIVVRPDGPWAARMDPWPFAGRELALPVPARTIPGRAYADADDLAAALAAADPVPLPAVVRPG
jgi:hypothetical protein